MSVCSNIVYMSQHDQALGKTDCTCMLAMCFSIFFYSYVFISSLFDINLFVSSLISVTVTYSGFLLGDIQDDDEDT